MAVGCSVLCLLQSYHATQGLTELARLKGGYTSGPCAVMHTTRIPLHVSDQSGPPRHSMNTCLLTPRPPAYNALSNTLYTLAHIKHVCKH